MQAVFNVRVVTSRAKYLLQERKENKKKNIKKELYICNCFAKIMNIEEMKKVE